MNIKKLKILGIILAFIICFPLHFLYDKFPNFITSIISPVNESIWEHMKILFSSILLSGVIQKIIVKIKKLDYKNICISNVIVSLLSIPIFLIIYLPIYNIIGETLIITLFIMLFTIIISQVLSLYIIKLKNLKLENVSIILVILIYTIFATLTFYPPHKELFKDPQNNMYGIKKD